MELLCPPAYNILEENNVFEKKCRHIKKRIKRIKNGIRDIDEAMFPAICENLEDVKNDITEKNFDTVAQDEADQLSDAELTAFLEQDVPMHAEFDVPYRPRTFRIYDNALDKPICCASNGL